MKTLGRKLETLQITMNTVKKTVLCLLTHVTTLHQLHSLYTGGIILNDTFGEDGL
jgi:hypothetical protein